jgi:HlyD family secretion protein
VLARLNTDNLSARVATNRANLKRSESAKERLTVELRNADRQAQRLRDLYEKGVVSQVDLENAEIARDSLSVQVKVASAEIEQAKTTLQQSEIDLEHATITSPIDGIVIQRAVEVGQTVAASFNSPLLFQIANDLGRMQIKANIDEADIGRIKRSIRASFLVDALPGRTFDAKLSQVRLNPTITNNVVIYTCIFNVDNFEKDGSLGPLLPGLTANLTILVEERDDALLVPAASPRFQPKGLASAVKSPGEASAASAPAASSPAGVDTAYNGEGGRGRAARNGGSAGASRPSRGAGGAMANTGTLWVRDGNNLRAVPVEIGITDGTSVEIVKGELKPGDLVAIGQAQVDAAPQGSFSPFGGPGGRPGGGMSGGGRMRGGPGR